MSGADLCNVGRIDPQYPLLIPPESIQIHTIDVSTYRRLWSRCKSNRFETSEPSEFETPIENQLPVQWEFEYFFALTLRPMGKCRCLEIKDYVGGYAAKAKCQSNLSTPSLSKHSFVGGSPFTATLFSAKTYVKAW